MALTYAEAPNPKNIKKTYFQDWFQKELLKLVESHNSSDQMIVLEFEDLGWDCSFVETLDPVKEEKKKGGREEGRRGGKEREGREEHREEVEFRDMRK